MALFQMNSSAYQDINFLMIYLLFTMGYLF